jgi:hypothetical protein
MFIKNGDMATLKARDSFDFLCSCGNCLRRTNARYVSKDVRAVSSFTADERALPESYDAAAAVG